MAQLSLATNLERRRSRIFWCGSKLKNICDVYVGACIFGEEEALEAFMNYTLFNGHYHLPIILIPNCIVINLLYYKQSSLIYKS